MGKSTKKIMIVFLITIAVAFSWNKIPLISEAVHFGLDPTAGNLLDWNIDVGMILFSAILSLFIILIQKYTTDQETLRQIKKEQKLLQEEMKKYKNHPEKLMALQKKQLEFIPRTFEITLRPLMYTSIPIILFFRWFSDYFVANPVKVFGFFSWFWAYVLFSIAFTSIFRKLFNVA